MATSAVVLTTFGTRADALRIGRLLVEERLAACVNVLGDVTSIYRWQDAVHEDPEVLCVVKTTRARLAALKARLIALHPYEVPELLALPVFAGHAPYLAWLAASVRAEVSRKPARGAKTRGAPSRPRRPAG
jgi:periplasmic divalent cation tolerance protein